jgi:hypothetical protein
MIDDYVRSLARELAAVGVRGSDARRLLAEVRGHLFDSAAARGEADRDHADRDQAGAVAAFGRPDRLAATIAADLATARTRSAAYRTFLALAPAGIGYAVLFLTFPGGAGGTVSGPGALGIVGAIFFPQLAFVCGVLGLLRIVRLRREAVFGAGDLAVVRARVSVALGAGVLTLASLATVGLDQRAAVPRWWLLGALALAATVAPVLGLLGAALARSRRLAAGHAPASGTAVDDVKAVLAELPGLHGISVPVEPIRFALLVAGLVAFATALGGLAAGDPLDGLFRSGVEAIGVLVCYRVLGRRLGLRA